MLLKTERITVRVLKTDKEALEQIARIEGEAMAVIIRRLLRRRAHELGTFDDSQSDKKVTP